MKHKELRKLIKEMMSEDESSFKIEPNLAFKIYEILGDKVPELKTEFPTKSSFYYFINDNI